MGKILISAAIAAGRAGITPGTSVTDVIAVTTVIHVNLS
jgi:hypothetical protein